MDKNDKEADFIRSQYHWAVQEYKRNGHVNLTIVGGKTKVVMQQALHDNADLIEMMLLNLILSNKPPFIGITSHGGKHEFSGVAWIDSGALTISVYNRPIDYISTLSRDYHFGEFGEIALLISNKIRDFRDRYQTNIISMLTNAMKEVD